MKSRGEGTRLYRTCSSNRRHKQCIRRVCFPGATMSQQSTQTSLGSGRRDSLCLRGTGHTHSLLACADACTRGISYTMTRRQLRTCPVHKLYQWILLHHRKTPPGTHYTSSARTTPARFQRGTGSTRRRPGLRRCRQGTPRGKPKRPDKNSPRGIAYSWSSPWPSCRRGKDRLQERRKRHHVGTCTRHAAAQCVAKPADHSTHPCTRPPRPQSRSRQCSSRARERVRAGIAGRAGCADLAVR